jgi:hypothetical protein
MVFSFVENKKKPLTGFANYLNIRLFDLQVGEIIE